MKNLNPSKSTWNAMHIDSYQKHRIMIFKDLSTIRHLEYQILHIDSNISGNLINAFFKKGFKKIFSTEQDKS